MPERPSNTAGFSLVEALLSLAITLVAVTLVFQGSGMVESVYRVESRAADGTAEAKWAFDDIADELARAGYGMGDIRFALPFFPEDPTPSSDRITLRSNPDGRVGILMAELVASGVSVEVAGAELFEAGDRVLLTDRSGSESAEVLRADGESLGFGSLETADGSLRRNYSPYRKARILSLQEVRFGFESHDAGGSLLWKEISGERRRVLSRSLETVRFDHLDGHGRPMTHSQLELGHPVSAIRIHLRIGASARTASISSLTTAVALGRHSVTIDLPMVRPPRLTDDHLLIETGPVVESPMGPASAQ